MTTNAFRVWERGGAVLVDKPEGPTSHDVVAWARKRLGTRRVGHTGTLDPFASGLLILLVGPATRLAEYLSGLPKEYTATARLGVATDTHDAEGQVCGPREEWKTIGAEDVARGLAHFHGCFDQVPPQFSAKKVGGEPMYKKARRGERVDLSPVRVEVSEIRLTEFCPPYFTFGVVCSAGTYIRALARDVGQRLGTGAHLTELRRTRVGDFSVRGAMGAEALRAGRLPLPGQWIEAREALRHLPAVKVPPDAALRLRQGRRIALPDAALNREQPVAVLDGKGLLGIAEVREGKLAPRKILWGPATA